MEAAVYPNLIRDMSLHWLSALQATSRRCCWPCCRRRRPTVRRTLRTSRS